MEHCRRTRPIFRRARKGYRRHHRRNLRHRRCGIQNDCGGANARPPRPSLPKRAGRGLEPVETIASRSPSSRIHRADLQLIWPVVVVCPSQPDSLFRSRFNFPQDCARCPTLITIVSRMTCDCRRARELRRKDTKFVPGDPDRIAVRKRKQGGENQHQEWPAVASLAVLAVASRGRQPVFTIEAGKTACRQVAGNEQPPRMRLLR